MNRFLRIRTVRGHQINASRPSGAVQAEIGWKSIDQDLKELCSDRFRETIKKYLSRTCSITSRQRWKVLFKIEKELMTSSAHVESKKINQEATSREDLYMAYQDQGKKIIKLCGQPKENILTTSSSTSSTTSVSAVPHHSRGLVVMHSRKLSAMLGGSTSTRP
jgi:hypothetical protein